MNEHHATLLRVEDSTTKTQLYKSCQVGIGPNSYLYGNFIFWEHLAKDLFEQDKFC